MRIVGVVDLRGGCAVHARAGVRENYAPVRAVAGAVIQPGDALALARTYTDRLGVRELYVADLDAIVGRHGIQDAVVADLAALGAPLWLDAGASSIDQARHALDLGSAHVVVGIETLSSYDALAEICDAVGGDRVAVSLDLRNGAPVVSGIPPGEPAHVIAGRAAKAGASAVIVIDLARVGTSRGLDLDLIARVREVAANVTLLAGGGVRGLQDLAQLADAGCDGALVATTLHDGRIGAAEVAAARGWHRYGSPTR